jgi:hypothetical protein
MNAVFETNRQTLSTIDDDSRTGKQDLRSPKLKPQAVYVPDATGNMI